MPHPISQQMLALARRGAERLEPDARRGVAAFVRACQTTDGGFRGREPADRSDLYYSVFGAGCLRALGGCHASLAKLWAFLMRESRTQPPDFVHTAALVRLIAGASIISNDRIPALLARLEHYRTPDGGYSITPAGPSGTVYAAFLALLAYGDAGCPSPAPDALADSLCDLRSSDGGFGNEANATSGQTCATAAALLVLHALGRSADSAVIGWLTEQALPDDGFAPSPRMTAADLLSTATALIALRVIGEETADYRKGAWSLAERLWQDDGGFAGSDTDRLGDCEFTFYALAVLGI